MADRSPVDTAELRKHAQRDDWHRFIVGSDIRLMLAEIDALRAKLAESEAACAVLHGHAIWMSGASVFGSEGEAGEYFRKAVAPALTSLPASVLSHMEEDAALRDLERAARKQMELFEDAVRSARMDSPDPLDHYERTYKPALAHLDAVRAKGGG